jgi:hypothetical protein
MKTCIRCNKLKDYERYQVAPQNKDGYSSTCYDCVALERNSRKYNGATKVCIVCKIDRSLASYYGKSENKRDVCITCSNKAIQDKRDSSQYFEHDPYYKF